MSQNRTNYIYKKVKQKRILRNAIVGFIMLLIGVGIYVVLNFNKVQGNAAHHVQRTALSATKQAKQKEKPSYNFNAVQPVSPASLLNAYNHRFDYRAIGQISIPRFGINLNIYQGVGNVELNLGAGTMNPNEVMGKGNYALAGHNMDDGRSFFSPLYTAKVRGQINSDTKIMITDYKMVYYYKVTQSSFISRYRTDLLEDKPEFKKTPVISLFTCDWTGAGRLFVRGELTGYQSMKSASNYVKNSFYQD